MRIFPRTKSHIRQGPSVFSEKSQWGTFFEITHLCVLKNGENNHFKVVLITISI